VFNTTAPGRITISHRNEDTDLPAAFNYTLEQVRKDLLLFCAIC